MIAWNDFCNLVTSVLQRILDPNEDMNQWEAICAQLDESLFLVAGPGSGKTTALALRVLKFVFVDGADPSSILATTFTRKAAAELRSRILGWGDKVRKELIRTRPQIKSQLEQLDLNRIVTGTLDSIAEEVMRDNRAPGTQPAIVIEEFVADALMVRRGFFDAGRHNSPDLRDYVSQINGSKWNVHIGTLREITREVRDRFLHDLVDEAAYEANAVHPGVAVLSAAIRDYSNALEAEFVLDFASLEANFLRRLQNGSLAAFRNNMRVVLVDEYQDTNLLQEQIYFTLAQSVLMNGGAITVVGDDDQSLYRFRGATVELFRDFAARLQSFCNLVPRIIYLNHNYRSTQTIVSFYSEFVGLDPAYSPARVTGKPPLISARKKPIPIDYPILGIFRPDLNELAHDLAYFIDNVFQGVGVTVNYDGQHFQIKVNPQCGALGDCALLCSSPREYSSGMNPRPRLPWLLRQELAQLPSPLRVFNPRGEEFCEIPEVAILCGLILECIDPGSSVQISISKMPLGASEVMEHWRQNARDHIASNPSPNTHTRTLRDFVNAWQTRTPQGASLWPNEVDLMSLVYNLVTWIPKMQIDPEGLVYLEAISRTVSQSTRFSSYDSTIQNRTPHNTQSVKAALWDIFVPLATGAIDLAEELIEEFPRDRLNILSIHQSKGLEFPLTIVDVGSDFKTNHHTQAFKRFPKDGSRSHRLEDELRRYSRFPPQARSPRDRAFDDLVRQYFVAFSRTQDVLLLVGLGDQQSGPFPLVPNVATGWIRDMRWPWNGLPNVIHI
ncbi:MAG: UvrD-helicase domain-containing protein [Ktedonobacteraceae bacterium]